MNAKHVIGGAIVLGAAYLLLRKRPDGKRGYQAIIDPSPNTVDENGNEITVTYRYVGMRNEFIQNYGMATIYTYHVYMVDTVPLDQAKALAMTIDAVTMKNRQAHAITPITSDRPGYQRLRLEVR